MQLTPQLSKSLSKTNKISAKACPHCKEGGEIIIGRYVTISIGWDADHGYWHCLICGFIGFGSDFELLQYPLVACVGHTPRLPGQPRRKKIKY